MCIMYVDDDDDSLPALEPIQSHNRASSTTNPTRMPATPSRMTTLTPPALHLHSQSKKPDDDDEELPPLEPMPKSVSAADTPSLASGCYPSPLSTKVSGTATTQTRMSTSRPGESATFMRNVARPGQPPQMQTILVQPAPENVGPGIHRTSASGSDYGGSPPLESMSRRVTYDPLVSLVIGYRLLPPLTMYWTSPRRKGRRIGWSARS
jgi:hypothetical protein